MLPSRSAHATMPRARPLRLPWGTWLHRLVVILVYTFMLCPLVFVVWLSVFQDAVLTYPPSGYTLDWYVNAWENKAFLNGLILSLQVAALAAVFSVSCGILAALGLVRYRFRGAALINTLLLSPLLVPGIIIGISVYLFYIRAETLLDRDIVGSFGGLVLAHVCLTIPWTVRLVSASMVGLDPTIEEAARNLGASPMQALLRVTLPMLRPAIVAATLFSFIISFENLELSLSLVGPGNTTLPIAIMQYLEFNLDPTLAAVSTVQIILLGLLMLVTDRYVKLSRVI